ncbi:MAG: F0F1 ATP synthase subunit alpha [Deltaproteobacteria bacterium]|nr:F0F1 ATP synthase subunit alpha [Deltaproteobacteria bacterium]
MADARGEAAVREMSEAIAQAAAEPRPRVRLLAEGRVEAAAQGVLRLRGLPDVGAEELIEIEQGGPALVLGLQRGAVEAVALDPGRGIQAGARARALHRLPRVVAGEAILGRVLDPMGRALDGRPLHGRMSEMPLERRAPAIHERAAVHEPLYTGVLAVDAMFPIGRGQRELILGDEGTGKTTFAVDAMLRQRETGVVCIYVAIGRRRAEVSQVAGQLRSRGGRWAVVSAPQDGSPGLRYLAPYAGTAMAEWFVERGEDVLIVYDDLSAHAVAWRELSLLLRRPPGREAYPGDIFYLHSRLLERATQLSSEEGGGSLTALPIALTEDERLSAYIPTNLISITDGQIVLSRRLFAAGQKPAVDASMSVSRVGGKAQSQAFRELAGRLRLEYASFLELEVFARLGTRLEATTTRRLEIGRRVRMLLRAPHGAPLNVFDEVLRLLLVDQPELLLRIPLQRLADRVTVLVRRCRSRVPMVVERIDREAILGDADRRDLVSVLESELALEVAGSGESA